MNLSVIILAAGRGQRMQSTLPKVLQKLAGKPILHHILLATKKLAAIQTIVVHGYQGQAIINASREYTVDWAWQEKQLGTGHAVACAINTLQPAAQRILILCGDVPCIETHTLEKFLTTVPDDALGVLSTDARNPEGLGRIVRGTSGHITHIIEDKDATPSQLLIKEINSGIYIIPRKFLEKSLPLIQDKNIQKEYYLPDIIRIAIKNNIQVYGHKIHNSEEVLGVNSRQELAQLERITQYKKAKQLMAQGVILHDPHRIDIRGELTVGSNVSIDINAIFEGKVKLGDHVMIGPNVIIKDSIIAEHVSILANSLVESATIGPACQVGPFARLRPGTVLAEESKIGNFVETKNAHVGTGSKINHLSYIGDANIGSNVNIGAGTITCNYDSANKHQTIIENQAFVGSNSELVAPIRIGAGATIAAGTTLIEDVPSGALSLTKKRQKIIGDWKRPTKQKDS